MIAHCSLFRGKDVVKAFRNAREGKFDDRYHEHMAKYYPETPTWWFMAILDVSFVLGIIVTTAQDITLPVWAYMIALVLGIIAALLVGTLSASDTMF